MVCAAVNVQRAWFHALVLGLVAGTTGLTAAALR
jgi:hypothetical protein